jgi:hypothetical protein
MTTSAIVPSNDIDLHENIQSDIPSSDIPQSAIVPTEHEVTELIDSIKSASELDPALLYGSSVFDSTAMAPLSPASTVSSLIILPPLNPLFTTR